MSSWVYCLICKVLRSSYVCSAMLWNTFMRAQMHFHLRKRILKPSTIADLWRAHCKSTARFSFSPCNDVSWLSDSILSAELKFSTPNYPYTYVILDGSLTFSVFDMAIRPVRNLEVNLERLQVPWDNLYYQIRIQRPKLPSGDEILTFMRIFQFLVSYNAEKGE